MSKLKRKSSTKNIFLDKLGEGISESDKTFPADIYLFKVNNRNTRTRCEICSKLTIKTTERRLASFWCLYY